MREEDGYTVFDHLSQPSSSVVGEKKPIKAKTPAFVSKNAKGCLRSADHLVAVETLGKLASTQLKKMFN